MNACFSLCHAYNNVMRIWQGSLETWHNRADRVGEASISLLSGVQYFYRFMRNTLVPALRLHWLARPGVVFVLIRQIYFTGVQSLPWVLLMTFCAGVLSVYNIVPFAKKVEDLSLIGDLVNEVVVQEMGPLLIAIFLLTRSGVAVVTEIGNMHVRGEDMLLKSLGISLHEYLYLPRVLAFGLCGLILTFVFAGLSIWLGGLAVSWNDQMNFIQFLIEVRRGTTLEEVLIMIGKGTLYPMLSCGMLLYQGCRVGNNPNQIPIRATSGVLGSLIMIVLMDVAIGVLRIII